jgi:thiol:disulfide interchange protein DsbD
MVHLKKALGLILLACVIWLLWVFGIQTGLGDLSKSYKSSNERYWQNYSSTAVSQARQSGQGVFIDFTAGWCINCQVNDRLVLQNREVLKAFKDQGIVLFKADWTKYDPVITQALASFGREGVPVYVYYPPLSDTPVILPQLITPKMILERVKGIIIEGPKLWKK